MRKHHCLNTICIDWLKENHNDESEVTKIYNVN